METKNNRTTAWVVGGLALVLLIGGAVGYMLMNQPAQQNTETETTAETTEQTTLSAPQAESSAPTKEADATSAVTIVFTDNGFEKSSYSVKSGEAITVQNNSSSEVQFSSDDHPSHTDNPEINMQPIAAGASGTLTPRKAGTFGVHDHIRSQFMTELVVTE